MNQPTPSKPQHFDAEIEEWMRVLKDLRPSAVMRTETRVKPAVGAHWHERWSWDGGKPSGFHAAPRLIGWLKLLAGFMTLASRFCTTLRIAHIVSHNYD